MIERILVTGGCGFIGSNLVKCLTELGKCKEIVIYDDESTGHASTLASFPHRFISGDVRDRRSLGEAMEGVDAVVHLAADTRVIDSIANPIFNFDVNVNGTFNLLEAMRQGNVRRLINASTGGAIVGDALPPVHEAMQVSPASAYGASKASAEAYCSAYSKSYGLEVTSLRFSNVYGPLSLNKGSVVAAFIKNILRDEDCQVYGDGSQTRDFVFVEDLCKGIVQALETRAIGVFQLGSGKPSSVNDVLAHIGKVSGKKGDMSVRYHDFRDGEVRHNYADISKAQRVFGFKPNTDFADGVKKTWDFFVSHRESLLKSPRKRA